MSSNKSRLTCPNFLNFDFWVLNKSYCSLHKRKCHFNNRASTYRSLYNFKKSKKDWSCGVSICNFILHVLHIAILFTWFLYAEKNFLRYNFFQLLGRDMDCLIANSFNNISCNLRAKVKCIFNTMTFNQVHVELPVLFVFLNIVKSKVVKFVLTRVWPESESYDSSLHLCQ